MYKIQPRLTQQAKRLAQFLHKSAMNSLQSVYVTRPDVDASGLDLLRKRLSVYAALKSF